ncbi:MAG: hypothetical protein ACYDCO_02380 [Armatimonadota bacterium]
MHAFGARAFAILLGLLLLAAVCPAIAVDETKTTVNVVVDVTKTGRVDWTHREVRATGVGVASAMAKTAAQKKLYAREAAILAAERNLLQLIEGVAIDSVTTVADMLLKEDVIVRRVNGLLQGAVIVSEKALDGETYQVEMAVNLYGAKKAVSSSVDLSTRVTVLPPEPEPVQENAIPAAAPENTAPENPRPAAVTEPYTGLIVDCRSFALDRAMCPRILNAQKNNLLDNLRVTPEVLNERGLAAYFRSLNDPALKKRVGPRPLMVKAASIDGKTRFKTDVVLTDFDYAFVAAENGKAGFLDDLNIAFLIDNDR